MALISKQLRSNDHWPYFVSFPMPTPEPRDCLLLRTVSNGPRTWVGASGGSILVYHHMERQNLAPIAFDPQYRSKSKNIKKPWFSHLQLAFQDLFPSLIHLNIHIFPSWAKLPRWAKFTTPNFCGPERGEDLEMQIWQRVMSKPTQLVPFWEGWQSHPTAVL